MRQRVLLGSPHGKRGTAGGPTAHAVGCKNVAPPGLSPASTPSLVGLLPGAAAPPVNTPGQPSEEGDPQRSAGGAMSVQPTA